MTFPLQPSPLGPVWSEWLGLGSEVPAEAGKQQRRGHGCVSGGVRWVPDDLARAPGALRGGFYDRRSGPRCQRPGRRAALDAWNAGNARRRLCHRCCSRNIPGSGSHFVMVTTSAIERVGVQGQVPPGGTGTVPSRQAAKPANYPRGPDCGSSGRRGRLTATMGHRCCGNDIHGPPLRLPGPAEQHRWAIVAAATGADGELPGLPRAGPRTARRRTRTLVERYKLIFSRPGQQAHRRPCAGALAPTPGQCWGSRPSLNARAAVVRGCEGPWVAEVAGRRGLGRCGRVDGVAVATA